MNTKAISYWLIRLLPIWYPFQGIFNLIMLEKVKHARLKKKTPLTTTTKHQDTNMSLNDRMTSLCSLLTPSQQSLQGFPPTGDTLIQPCPEPKWDTFSDISSITAHRCIGSWPKISVTLQNTRLQPVKSTPSLLGV